MTTTEQDRSNESLLKALAATAFFIFFNGYLVAPLIPALAHEFSVSEYQMGWVVPAYLIPYGISTLFYGALSDRFGRRNVLLILLLFATLSTFAVSLAWSANSLIAIRFLGGVGSGGVVTIALALVGDMYPYEKLGRPMGWMFGAIAGGMAFGATLGAWLNPSIGWRNEFVILSVFNALLLIFLFRIRHRLTGHSKNAVPFKEMIHGYSVLLKNSRGARTFAYIFLNGAFHGGIFAWLGYYLEQRYQIGDAGIGQALLGYGIPGMFLGPVWGRLADRFGRRRIIPFGFLVAAVCALLLIPVLPLWSATVAITCLSVGLDMSHPLMAGIVASLDPKRRGQAMGLNAFAIFFGFGLGAVMFQNLMLNGIGFALLVFGSFQFAIGLFAFRSFNAESTRQPALVDSAV